MIDLSNSLDTGTNFPETWKTLVRELLLKFEDGCTYTHKNIAGNRPYTVNLKITIDDPVDDKEYEELHQEAENKAEMNQAVDELMTTIATLIEADTDENITTLKQLNNKLKKLIPENTSENGVMDV